MPFTRGSTCYFIQTCTIEKIDETYYLRSAVHHITL